MHYLDITGEIDVFELAHSVDEKAHRSGIVLCPGVGFDVVPTDCIAARLKQEMPDATHLALGFDSNSGLSKGTAKTAIESAGGGSRVRRDGRIVEMPLASAHTTHRFRRRRAPRGRHSVGRCQHCVLHDRDPQHRGVHGDFAEGAASMRRANLLRPLLRQRWVRGLVKFGIERRVKPPDQAQRDNNPSFVWGEARNAAGQTKTARLRTANGYSLTVHPRLAFSLS